MDNLPFDYRKVFITMNRNSVSYLLIGGLNYFLIHNPVTTQDIDLFIDETPENRFACENALIDLGAEWGQRDDDWGPVHAKPMGWLGGQSVFCLLTRFGPVDIFLSVPGISSYGEALSRSVRYNVDADLQLNLISARDLLDCQLAIPEAYRKPERINFLRGVLENVR